MAVIGTLLKELVGGHDKKLPSSAFNLDKVSPDTSQMSAIGGNLAALPKATSLASSVNLFNQQQIDLLNEMAAPGRAGVMGQERDIVSSMLRGEIPKDVQNLVLSRANARAQGGGYGGSGAAGALGARDLGLTSLDITNKGIDAATKWLAQSQTAPLFNLGAMFQSPDKRYQFDVEERNTQFNASFAQARNKATAKPFNAALGQAFIEDEKAIMSMVGSAAGLLGCWVARKVYGNGNPRWLEFRSWLLNEAPADLRDLYLTHGSRIADRMSDGAKARIRVLMDGILGYA